MEGENRRPARGGHRQAPVRNNNQGGNSNPYCGTIDKIEMIIPDSYVGEGIKRTEAFTITLTEDQYDKWKEQFWETRVEGLDWVWKVLKEAVTLEQKEAKELLLNKGIKPDDRLGLKMCYDEKGRSYILPPAMINEPVGFGEDKEKNILEAIKEPDEEMELTLILRNASNFEDDEIQISDHSSVNELKEKYAELKDVDDIAKIRILYYGKELKEGYNLYHYDINEEIILIVVVNNELYD